MWDVQPLNLLFATVRKGHHASKQDILCTAMQTITGSTFWILALVGLGIYSIGPMQARYFVYSLLHSSGVLD